jgi:hypothetical protein
MDIFVKLARGINNERYDSILEEHLQQGVVYFIRNRTLTLIEREDDTRS